VEEGKKTPKKSEKIEMNDHVPAFGSHQPPFWAETISLGGKEVHETWVFGHDDSIGRDRNFILFWSMELRRRVVKDSVCVYLEAREALAYLAY